MDIHPAVEKLKNLLESHNIPYRYFEHEPVCTSKEAAKVRPGYSLKQGAKALVVKVYAKNATLNKSVNDLEFVMLVIPGDAKFSSRKVKGLLNAKDVQFASQEEIKEITNGVQVGGIPPFGSLFGIKTYVDKNVFQNQTIIFNAGDKRVSIAISVDDYVKVENPAQVDIV